VGGVDDARIRRNARVVYRQLADGDAVLLHLDTAAYHGINDIGALIWELIADGPTFPDLLARLRARLDGAPPTLEQEIASYLDDLSARDLIDHR